MDEFELDMSDFDTEADQPGDTADDQVQEDVSEAEEETEVTESDKEEETEETEEEEETADDGNEQTEESKSGTDQSYELKHFGQSRNYSIDELKTLASKGLDYDRLKEESKRTADAHEAFLKEMAGNQTIEDFIDSVRARKMVQTEKIDEALALQRVKFEREKANFEASKTAVDPLAKIQNDAMVEFKNRFPGMKSNDIPDDVWRAFAGGENLTVAYLMNKNQELESKLKTAEQNAKNAKRATGSLKSTGKSKTAPSWDDFDL